MSHLSLQSDPGLLGQGELLLVPLPDVLQRGDLGLGRLQLAAQSRALPLHLLELALQGCHLLPQVMHWKQAEQLRGLLHTGEPAARHRHAEQSQALGKVRNTADSLHAAIVGAESWLPGGKRVS